MNVDFLSTTPPNQIGTIEFPINKEGTYTENCDGEKMEMATWPHPLSEVINSLVNNGIAIEFLNEFPFSPYNCFEDLEEREKGRFYASNLKQTVPLIYSIKGTKSGE